MEQENLENEWFEKLSNQKKLSAFFGMLAISCGFCSDERKNEKCPFKKCLAESKDFEKMLNEVIDKEKLQITHI